MRQFYHSIIKPRSDGSYVGWVEEIPGTITKADSIDACRQRLREALELMIETNRSEARLWVDNTCLQEFVEVDLPEQLRTEPMQRVY
jgi:predicted RNase H-like HicB family nuclease